MKGRLSLRKLLYTSETLDLRTPDGSDVCTVVGVHSSWIDGAG